MVQLTRAQHDEVVAHAQETPSEEVCGVLGGRDNRVESLFRALSPFRYDSDSGPLRFVTLAQIAAAMK